MVGSLFKAFSGTKGCREEDKSGVYCLHVDDDLGFRFRFFRKLARAVVTLGFGRDRYVLRVVYRAECKERINREI